MEYTISDNLKSIQPSAIREILKNASGSDVIAFSAGNPAPESFPVKEIAEITSDIFANKSTQALQYGITEGYAPLIDAVKSRLSSKFGIGSKDDELIITSGGQQAIELVCRTLCNRGDVVITEDPTFIGALNAFRANGTVVKSAPMKEYGIDIVALEKMLKTEKNVKLLYLITNFQNPMGTTMDLKTRCEIYELACKYSVMIIEDNPYGELRFGGKDVPTIKSMDTAGIVCYCGSFSKIFSPSMRVGFLCAPKGIMPKVVCAKQVEDVHTNMLFQMMCAEFMEKYDLDAHIKNIQNIYRKKAEIMLDALSKYMPPEVKYTKPEGGLFIWCTLPPEIDGLAFVKEASENKVAVVPGIAFAPDKASEERLKNSFRITYATPSDEQIAEGVKILADIINKYLGK